MRKIFFILCCCLIANIATAAGIDLEFCGFKIFNVGFDANPFSRDDGRTSSVCVTSCAPQYYAPPPRTAAVAAAVQKRTDEQSIVVRDSSNVTIINQESQRTSRPVYAPMVQTSYPMTYSYPVYYTYPAYYRYPYYHYYRRPCYRYYW